MNLLRWLRGLKESRSEPTFEQIMVQVQEDEKCRKTVLWLCRLNEFQRRSLLRTQLQVMELKRAPAELRALFHSLEDQGFADKVVQFLNDNVK